MASVSQSCCHNLFVISSKDWIWQRHASYVIELWIIIILRKRQLVTQCMASGQMDTIITWSIGYIENISAMSSFRRVVNPVNVFLCISLFRSRLRSPSSKYSSPICRLSLAFWRACFRSRISFCKWSICARTRNSSCYCLRLECSAIVDLPYF